MMSKASHGRIFLKGLAFTLPIALSIGILVWAFRSAEALLGKPLHWLLPNALHFPGLGIILGVAAIYLLGLAIHGRFSGFIFNWLDTLLSKIPVFSLLYDNIKELTQFLSGAKDNDLKKVVLVTLKDDLRLIGFVTRENTEMRGPGGDELHAVYLPMSYQMGGYTLYLPESKLQTLEITTQEAMRRILTADIAGGKTT